MALTKVQKDNRSNGHLANCLRRLREELIANKPVKAMNILEMLEREIYGVQANEQD
jgi:hypothetical protein